jgi:threonine/homoserine/homoserine lactone efflux protein
MVTAFLLALLMSFFGSMPLAGPIALLVFERGLRGLNREARLIASGAAIAEGGYAFLAYLGVNLALSRFPVNEAVLRLLAGIIIVAVAMESILRRNSRQPEPEKQGRKGADFLLGFTIAALNPTFLATWTGGIAVARGLGFILAAKAASLFALGVMAGALLWFSFLLLILRRYRGRFRPELLATIAKVLWFILLGLGAIVLAHSLPRVLHIR